MFYPLALTQALSSASVVGFSGSRSSVPPALAGALRLVKPEASVYVGDAAGVDHAVWSALQTQAVLFSVAGVGRGAVAARSVRFVRALAAAGGVLLVFPGGPCPAGVTPSASSSHCFCGGGSGSWATAAFAAGLGLRVFIYSPTGVPAWGFESLGGGWFSISPAGVQPTLF